MIRATLWRTRWVVAAVAFALLLAGCGGASVESVDASPELPAERAKVEVELTTPELESSCSTEGIVYDLAVFDDRVVFAGEFSAVFDASGNRFERSNLAACTTDGEFIESFDTPVDGLVWVVTHYRDQLLVGGSFTLGDLRGENFVAVDAMTGEVNPDFGPRSVMGSVHAISISPSDQIYVAGAFAIVDGVRRSSIVRLDSSGEFDSVFSPRLTRTDDDAAVRVVYSVVEAGNWVYIGGDYGTLNGEEVPGIGAVDKETGRITSSFAPDLDDTNPLDGRVQVRKIVVHDDWIYLCGDWWTTEGRGDKEEQRNFGRFSLTGEADATLEPSNDGGIRDCRLIGDTLIGLGGHFDFVSGRQFRKLVIVSLETGEIIRAMGADSNQGVQVLAFDDGVIYVGGTFTKIRGVDQPGLGAIRIAE